MSSWAQTLTTILTLAGLFLAGFGFLWRAIERLGDRIDRLEGRVGDIDRRLAHIEGERGVIN